MSSSEEEEVNLTIERVNNVLQRELQELKAYVRDRFNDTIDALAMEVRQQAKYRLMRESDVFASGKYHNRRTPAVRGRLGVKEFVKRESPMTDLFEIIHIRTMYNLLIAALIILLIDTAVYDIRHTGMPNLGIYTVQAGFAKFSVVLWLWPLMQAATLLVYPSVYCWSRHRFSYAPRSFLRRCWDSAWMSGFVTYQFLFFSLPVRIVIDHDLPIACSMIILMEQVRMVMKTYAFVRSVTPRFMVYKTHSDMRIPQMPSFSKYLYFLFAPTLLYRDSYPRTTRIRWKFVVTNFIEVATIILVLALLYERMLYPRYKYVGQEKIEMGDLALNILSSMIPGFLMFLCGFYLLLHCWMNAFAELLMFGDRMFYQDWWNSVSFRSYYRTWNVIVHDWLYEYIYKDMYEFITPNNWVLSTCVVFVVSAIMHEYIICCSSRFLYPVMFLTFGGIGLMVHLQFMLKVGGNLFILFSLGVGSGTFVSLYCMEYFARINCPQIYYGYMNFIWARTWSC